jgi:hypothetical protein
LDQIDAKARPYRSRRGYVASIVFPLTLVDAKRCWERERIFERGAGISREELYRERIDRAGGPLREELPFNSSARVKS